MQTPIKIIFGIYIISLLLGCNKSPNKLNTFEINIKNDYFECIDSIRLNNLYWENICPNQISSLQKIDVGSYLVSCYTHSSLLITAYIHIQGSISHLTFRISQSGEISILK